MARISLNPPRTLSLRLTEWYSRRGYGKTLTPAKVFGHHPQIMRAYFTFEMKASRWKQLDQALKHLAVLSTASKIGCSWCVDFGYWEAEQLGLPIEKINKVPTWKEHRETFTEVELLIMEYAEAMSDTPPTVTDELTTQLINHLGETAYVELTTMVGLENLRSRINTATGLTSQGFSTTCTTPPTQ